MKKLKTIILLLSFSTGILFSSCNDWLDVLSNEEILEEDAFATTKGFRSALVGAYELAAVSDFYGREMTWGMMSALSLNYTYNSVTQHGAYTNLIRYRNFDNTYIEQTFDKMWKAAYKVIANCNNLLQNIETTDQPFEYTWEKGMIVAEAKALRALMHFELLRLFVKAPILGNTEKAIPYVTTYPNLTPEYQSTKYIMDNIIKDLEEARTLLRPVDVDILWGESIMPYFSTMLFIGIQNLLDDGTRGNGDGANGGFFCMRGFRLNYWGVTALLARVHSYNRDNEKAVVYANEVIVDWFESGVGYEWAWYAEPNSNKNKIDGKRMPEPLIMFWNTKVAENYSKAAGTNYFKMPNLTHLFGGDISLDYRYTAFYNTSTQQYLVWKDNDETLATDRYVTAMLPACPVLEMPEMYYIRAEYLAEQNRFDEAKTALKQVRQARNLITDLPAVNSKDEFMELLVNDLTRDFLTRGQTWFYLKKLNYKKMYEGNPVWWDVPDEWYVLPIPESETMY